MGKSPAKWIKTVLLGKKTSKSNSSKGKNPTKATTEKDTLVAAKEPTIDFPVDPPSVSQSINGTTIRNIVEEKEHISDFPCDEGGAVPRTDVDKQGTTTSDTPDDPERIRLEQAATKAQAAFRGYLARRAFHALKGIIKLQALIRGHLVRRQAITTLRCLQGIIKLQALVRARKVKGGEMLLIPRVKLSDNAFVSRLLTSSPNVAPLRVQYDLRDSNAAWNWLDRWTTSRLCESIPQQKKVIDLKSQSRQDQGRSKRTIRKVASDNGVAHSLTSETEKPKRNFKKSASHPAADIVQETPENELEKVKRSLRKVSSSNLESNTDRLEVEIEKTEKPKRIFRKASNPDIPDKTAKIISSETDKLESSPINEQPNSPSLDILTTPTPSKEPDLLIVHPTPDIVTSEEITENTTTTDPIEPDVVTTTPQPLNLPPLELLPSEEIKKDEKILMSNGDNPKTSKRRASITTTPTPTKEEYLENGLGQNSPTVPSYMAATASAKAKLRAGGSPRLSQDVSAEKNGTTRRHSLPSSISNGKMNSMSPRTQRLVVQTNGKGGVKNDKSLLASRDGNDKIVHAGWRR
ncbi:IQ-domain [Ranunculus cassubicifolius]